MNTEKYTFFYHCRKCNKKIEASCPDYLDSAIMIEIKKNNYEFECKNDCKVAGQIKI